jgi:hypothetical protein
MRAIAAAGILIVALASPSAETPQVRDVERPPTTGTGSLSGIVVSEPDAAPVRRAVVTLTGADLRPSRGAITGDDGRFRIANLPAGRFTLTVARGSFITSVHGARRAGRAGTAIAVGEAEVVSDLVVRLWRGAAVAGVIRDEAGTPVEGVTVTAVPARPSAQSTRTLSNNGVVTNDLGEFRVFGLPPGTYVVTAAPPSSGPQAIVAMSDAEVDAALARLTLRAPGVAPIRAAGAAPTSGDRPFDYAPIFYPGTASRAQAAPITLAAGMEHVGLDFALQRIATVFVEGTVSRPDGQPAAGAAVQLVEVVPAGPFAPVSPRLHDATVGADGRFRIARAATGTYELFARIGGPADLVTPAGSGQASDAAAPLWASADLTISTSDVAGIALTLQPGRVMSGRVGFEGMRPPPALTSVRVSLVPIGVLALPTGAPIRTLQTVASASVREDGTFTVSGIGPGSYRLYVGATTLDGWWPRSALRGGTDLFDADILVDATTDLSGVAVTLSEQRTTLSGSLQTPAGVPVTDVFVIAFAADRRYWGPRSRRVQAVRPASDGTFTIAGLPAGDYRLAAVTDVDLEEWEDPAFLALALAASIPVSLAEGETKTQDLRLGGP